MAASVLAFGSSRTASIPGDSRSSASAHGVTSSQSSPSSASSTAHLSPSRKPTSNSSSATPASATWASCSSASSRPSTLNQIGVAAAGLKMLSHGVITGLLFAIVGRIVYDRTHTRQLAELETMHLSRRLPFAAWAFVVAGIASIGMPGFSGFWAEMQVLVGAWAINRWWVLAAGIGIVVGVAYIWRALQKAFFSDLLPSAHVLEQEHGHAFAAI